MLFNTFEFAYFLAIVLPVYWVLSHRWQNVLLLGVSYYFYACWNPKFLTLLVLSTVVDYACGWAVDRIETPRRRKLFVALSMAFNLGMLGYFKYYNFFAESLQDALARAGWNVPLAHLEVILPIGISFYTFQSMSYVIDVYRREIKPTRNLVQFAAFVSFFPHLVAGPIMRPTTLLPQIERKRHFDLTQFYQGCYLIFWGLTKKVVVADNLAPIVNDLFGRWESIDGGLALLAGICDVAEEKLDTSTRIGLPPSLEDLPDELDHPGWATAIGLVQGERTLRNTSLSPKRPTRAGMKLMPWYSSGRPKVKRASVCTALRPTVERSRPSSSANAPLRAEPRETATAQPNPST